MFSYCKGEVYFREKARTLLSYPMWPRRPLVAGAISKQISALSPFNLQHCYLKRFVFSGTPTLQSLEESQYNTLIFLSEQIRDNVVD